MTDSDPWNLIEAARYHEALAEYDRRIRSGSATRPEIANRATTLLCLGRLKEALDGFVAANEIDEAESRGAAQSYLGDIAAVLWLLDRKGEAISILQRATNGIRDGTIEFTDASGGASPGLLLWYAAVALNDKSVLEEASAFLTHILRSKRATLWPGSLAMYVAGGKSEAEVLMEVSGTEHISAALRLAANSFAVRRPLVKALFYFAVSEEQRGDAGRYGQLMTLCANLENPLVEMEWFLAQAETGHSIGAGLTA